MLFFTHNVVLADRLARTTGESERIEQEIEVQGWKKLSPVVFLRVLLFFFWFFFGFFGVFLGGFYIFAQKREFLGFFQFHEYF